MSETNSAAVSVLPAEFPTTELSDRSSPSSSSSQARSPGDDIILWKLVDAKCEQLKDAVRGARLAFLAVLLWSFIWFSALYNHEFGYGVVLLGRYETALAAASNPRSQACGALQASWIARYHPALFKAIAGTVKGTGNVEAASSLQAVCLSILQKQHDELLKQQIESWHITVPGVPVSVSIFDMGTLGAAGLLMLLIWFNFSTRRENHAVRAFVDIQGTREHWLLPPEYDLVPQSKAFSAEHYSYAYQAVAQRFLLLFSTRATPLMTVTLALISFPFLICFWNWGTDVRDLALYWDKIAAEVWPRFVIGTLLFCLAGFFTLSSLFRTVQTSVILNGWYLASSQIWERALSQRGSSPAGKVKIDRNRQVASPSQGQADPGS